MRDLYIAETAFSHEGSKKYLFDLIYMISETNINCVKLQVMLDKYDLFNENHPAIKSIDSFLLPESDWVEIFRLIREKHLLNLVAVLDRDSLNLVVKNIDLVDYLDIHSSCLVDIDFLEEVLVVCEKYNKPLFMSISGYTFSEIKTIYEKCVKYDVETIFMYGFQNYPTPINAIDLNKIENLKDTFNLSVGYADHMDYNSEDKDYIILNVLLNYSNIIEVHCVLNEGDNVTDYITAISPDRYDKIINRSFNIKKMLGSGTLDMNKYELEYANKFKKVPVCIRDISSGERLTKENMKFQRMVDNKCNRVDNFIYYNSIVKKKIKKNTIINREDLEK